MTGSFATDLAPTDVNLPPAISASAPVTGTQGPQSESDSSLTRMFYWSHSTDFNGAATDFWPHPKPVKSMRLFPLGFAPGPPCIFSMGTPSPSTRPTPCPTQPTPRPGQCHLPSIKHRLRGSWLGLVSGTASFTGICFSFCWTDAICFLCLP